MQDNFSIRNWKHTKLYKESYEGSLEGIPSQEEVTNFLEKFGQEPHYLFSKPVSSWDEYDLSNWEAKKRRFSKQEVAEENDYEADAEDIEFEIPGAEDATPVIDKSLNKIVSKQDKIVRAYKDINDQMQSALQDFKTSEGDAKEVAKETLRSLTPSYRAAKDAYEKLKGIKL